MAGLGAGRGYVVGVSRARGAQVEDSSLPGQTAASVEKGLWFGVVFGAVLDLQSSWCSQCCCVAAQWLCCCCPCTCCPGALAVTAQTYFDYLEPLVCWGAFCVPRSAGVGECVKVCPPLGSSYRVKNKWVCPAGRDSSSFVIFFLLKRSALEGKVPKASYCCAPRASVHGQRRILSIWGCVAKLQTRGRRRPSPGKADPHGGPPWLPGALWSPWRGPQQTGSLPSPPALSTRPAWESLLPQSHGGAPSRRKSRGEEGIGARSRALTESRLGRLRPGPLPRPPLTWPPDVPGQREGRQGEPVSSRAGLGSGGRGSLAQVSWKFKSSPQNWTLCVGVHNRITHAPLPSWESPLSPTLSLPEGLGLRHGLRTFRQQRPLCPSASRPHVHPGTPWPREQLSS
ncbi:uncharacterized protein LOC144364764 [Ictidomys tridecemlineatus]